MHAVLPSPIVKDPEYTVYWLKVGESAGLNVEVLDRMQFKLWTQHFYSSSSCYRKPDEKDCYRGPHKGKWQISACKQFNFGTGEDDEGKVVTHHGTIFMKNDLFQTKPDEVVVRKRSQSFDEE